MIVTKEIVEQGISRNGGYSQKQMDLFGIMRPLLKGWKKRMVGVELDEKKIEEFLKLKDKHLKPATQSPPPSLF